MSARNLAVYIFLAVVWGHSFLLLLHVVQAFGWGAAVSLRALIAGVTLALYSYARGERVSLGSNWKAYVIVGGTAIAGLLVGMSYATPLIGTAMAAIFVSAIPLFSLCIGRLWGLERFTPLKLFGLLLGIAGIAMMVGYPDKALDGAFMLGCLASILGSIASAYGSNYASLHVSNDSSVQVTYRSFFTGGVITLPLLLVVPIPTVPQLLDYVYLILSACVMSAMTYVLYFDLIKRIGATRTISVEFVVTLVAILIGAFYLGENLSGGQVAGMASVLLGCALALELVVFPVSKKVSGECRLRDIER